MLCCNHSSKETRGRSETYVDRVSSIVCLDSDLKKTLKIATSLAAVMRLGIFSRIVASIAEINAILFRPIFDLSIKSAY